MTKGKYIAIAVIIVALAGGAIALSKHKDKDPAANATASNMSQDQETDAAESGTVEQGTSEATAITYGDNGFTPSTITVKSGTTVTIKNESSRSMQFDSDPHPAHTGNEELNVNNVSPGESETFVVKRTGTFGYHNHLNPSDTGTIIVQ